jgi:hypothetical protein
MAPPVDLDAAMRSLCAQQERLSRIVRLECQRARVPADQAQRLAERINHWWLHGSPEPEPESDVNARMEWEAP